MSRTEIAFVGGLWAAGLLSGLLVARYPEAVPLPVPHLTVALIIGLIADLALMPSASAGRIAPLSMNARGLGVIGAAVVSLVAGALAAP